MDDDPRTPDDLDAARAIMNAVDDGDQLVTLIYRYYQDHDRADRTPRATLYLHLGLLSGAYLRKIRPAAMM